MSAKDSETHCGSAGGSKFFLSLFLRALEFSEGGGWMRRSGRGPSREGGGLSLTLTSAQGRPSIPDGCASAVKYLTCQTSEVTEGEALSVQWDFDPGCDGATATAAAGACWS